METMMAVFDDEKTRDNAVTVAQEQGVDVAWIGSARPVFRECSSDAPPRPFVLFRGGMMAGLVFMQNGAGSCGPA